MTTPLDTPWNPATREQEIYAEWEDRGYFQPGNPTGRDKFSICIPPPNVTGSLHMGHALNNTLQDALVRFERMRGKAVLWQPGMDHAGIATQMVVERKLAAEGQKRSEMSREDFIAKVWEWKEESGGRILEQLKRLGSSADWSRTKFTLGDRDGGQMAEAITKAFVDLYNDGLIYRDKRLVNWDPHFQTAISDLEVENVERDGHFWHFKYPLEGSETYTYVEKDEDGNVTLSEERDYISIATTRPETMLGDGAVAVHPDDERYKSIVGKMVRLPLADRLIPIIADEYPDPDFGSGAVKITGAHDFNDHEVAKRHDLPMYALMGARGEMIASDIMPEKYVGMDRFDARKAVVADIDAQGLLVAVEDKKIMQPIGDRSKAVIEPMLTDQWFVDAEKMAGPAIEAVTRTPISAHPREGGDPSLQINNKAETLDPGLRRDERKEGSETQFIPANWTKTYDHWMENIQPWCISRQLWWGHRIPAWFGPTNPFDYFANGPEDGLIPFVASTEYEAVRVAKSYYAEKFGPDVVKAHVSLHDDGRVRKARHNTNSSGVMISGTTATVVIYQDPDVLDTWFSSALWPFSTLGWPEDSATLDAFYPTSTLITGHDIIFFWVARMMMMGLHFRDLVPFHDVYIHALVLDEQGKKMSKSEGNVIDPLDLIDGIGVDALVEKRTTGLRQPEKAPKVAKATRKQYPDGFESYGADALRFTLASLAGQGRNIRLSVERVAGYRNFGTKLWNAARFAQMNGVAPVANFDPSAVQQPINRWLVAKASAAITDVTDNLERYRFNDATDAAYKFAWNTVFDWYVELSKSVLSGPGGAEKAETQATMAWALDTILKLLHPFMPFITEELWHKLGERETWLIVSDWPAPVAIEATDEIDRLTGIITALRSVRSEMNVPPSRKAPLIVTDAGAEDFFATYAGALEQMGRVSDIVMSDTIPEGSLNLVADGVTYGIPLSGLVDLDAERARLSKAIAKTEDEIARIDKKLGNENFVAKAPEAVVSEQKLKRKGFAEEAEKLKAALGSLG